MDTWLAKFDHSLQTLFAIDHVDAGLDAEALARYRDLEPREAALTFGQDYDLERVDGHWGILPGRFEP